MRELLPCPFCGGEAIYVEHDFTVLGKTYGVKCHNCGTQSFQFCGERDVAKDAWNRRTYTVSDGISAGETGGQS